MSVMSALNTVLRVQDKAPDEHIKDLPRLNSNLECRSLRGPLVWASHAPSQSPHALRDTSQ